MQSDLRSRTLSEIDEQILELKNQVCTSESRLHDWQIRRLEEERDWLVKHPSTERTPISR